MLLVSFVNGVWVLQCPTVLFTNKGCDMGHLAYSPCPIAVLRRPVVGNWRFNSPWGSHLQSQVIVLVS